MTIDFYLRGERKKKKEPPHNKRRRFPAPRQSDCEPRVSDHCIVQYQNRVLEMDTDGLRESIFAEAQPFIESGACSYTDSAGVRFIIENGVVVTCYPVNQPKP